MFIKKVKNSYDLFLIFFHDLIKLNQYLPILNLVNAGFVILLTKQPPIRLLKPDSCVKN